MLPKKTPGKNEQGHKYEDNPKNKDIPGNGDDAKIWIVFCCLLFWGVFQKTSLLVL